MGYLCSIVIPLRTLLVLYLTYLVSTGTSLEELKRGIARRWNYRTVSSQLVAIS
jgi:hypothetical protein